MRSDRHIFFRMFCAARRDIYYSLWFPSKQLRWSPVEVTCQRVLGNMDITRTVADLPLVVPPRNPAHESPLVVVYCGKRGRGELQLVRYWVQDLVRQTKSQSCRATRHHDDTASH